MKKWFLSKVRYQKENENGLLKAVTESYLVDAVSFTEAESRMYEEMGERVIGEFDITAISISKISDVFKHEDSDIWHQCKIQYYVAEESGKERKVTQYMLLTANNCDEAYKQIQEDLNNMLVSFEVKEVKESPILEVFDYNKESKE